MRIAGMQGAAKILDVEANLAVMDRAAAQAAAAGADVLVTPELFPCGYAPARLADALSRSGAGLLQPIDDGARDIAMRHGIALVYSAPVPAEGGGWHISATMLDGNGEQLLRYFKVHLFGAEEQAAFRPGGSAPESVLFRGFRVGLAICYDVEFPEIARALADAGSDVALVPTALAAGFRDVPQVLLRARALESQLAIAYVNHSGKAPTAAGTAVQLGGGSIIVGPRGQVLAEGSAADGDDADELILADICPADVAAARAAVPYLRDRRTDLYTSWQPRPHGSST